MKYYSNNIVILSIVLNCILIVHNLAFNVKVLLTFLFKHTCTAFILDKVAFDVRLKNHKRNLATKAKVIFETVDLNEGLGYDASSGVFTAPSGGLYVFDWTVMAWQKQFARTSLVVNDQEKSWNFCFGSTTDLWLPCSKMTIVRLKQGDKAWIGVNAVQAHMHETHTSFSGYKL